MLKMLPLLLWPSPSTPPLPSSVGTGLFLFGMGTQVLKSNLPIQGAAGMGRLVWGQGEVLNPTLILLPFLIGLDVLH